jgi:hypothetical protein
MMIKKWILQHNIKEELIDEKFNFNAIVEIGDPKGK